MFHARTATRHDRLFPAPGRRRLQALGLAHDDFWCCHGSLVQAHTLYPAGIYFEDDAGLVVSQYIPTGSPGARGVACP